MVPKDNIKIINKQKLFKRENNYDKESLVAEVINIESKSVLEIEKGNLTFENYNKNRLNPGLPGIRSSIKRQDKLLRKFIKTKDEMLKGELYST